MTVSKFYVLYGLIYFMATDLTQGSVFKRLIAFSLPYLLACFLQTFYGVADLVIVGYFNGASTITAVSVGSQIMHMITLLLAGIAMGTTVLVGRAYGAKEQEQAAFAVGNSISLFTLFSVVLTVVCLLATDAITTILQTPVEAFDETSLYSRICFLGIPFIAAFNVLASTCRGAGDTKHPMMFVAFGGILNIILDYILIGPCGFGSAGAAWATVISQVAVVIIGFALLPKLKLGLQIARKHLHIDKYTLRNLLTVGIPAACQDGFIQITFLFITAIANSRGLEVATSVGIVEKLICFFFLVPSSMLASVSALAAQNRGAGLHDRGKLALRYGIYTCMVYGVASGLACQFISPWLLHFFTNDGQIITYGTQYLRFYSFDAMIAGVHFCFGAYFCSYNKAGWAFFHNAVSSVTVRIPGTWLASVMFPLTLTPMGAAAPLGSVLSICICLLVYLHYFRSNDRLQVLHDNS